MKCAQWQLSCDVVAGLPPVTVLHGTADLTCPHEQASNIQHLYLLSAESPAEEALDPRI